MKVRIRDIGEIYTGNTPSKKNILYWNSDDIGFVKPDIIADDAIIRINKEKCKEFISFCAIDKARIVPKNSVFVTCIGSIGKIGISKDRLAFNQQINAIVPNKNIDKEYLAYALYANKKKIQNIANAPVVPIINKTQFNDFELNIEFDTNKQYQITETLNIISTILDKMNKELELLDELVKARFVEMFGDMKPTVKLNKYIIELRAGKSLAGNEICKNKVLKTGAATFGFFDKDQYKYYPKEYKPNPLHKVETGDVIISRMNTPELVGACSYVYEAPDNTYYPDRLWKVIVNENTNPIFLWQLMWQQEIRKQIKENSYGTSGTMNNISKIKLLNINAIDVPISLQNQFADFVKEVDKSRFIIKSMIKEGLL